MGRWASTTAPKLIALTGIRSTIRTRTSTRGGATVVLAATHNQRPTWKGERLPDTQVVIERVWTSEGEGDYGPYTKYDVQPAEDRTARYVTYKDELGLKAQANVGRKVLLTWEAPKKEGNRPKLVNISDPLDDTVSAPTPGTGDYVKGKEAPETRRSIAAAVALKEAVNTWSASTKDIQQAEVLEWADSFYEWLISKSEAASPEKANESVTEPTQEQRDKLAALLEKLNTQSPKQEGQESWKHDLMRHADHVFGKHEGLTGEQYGQLIEQAEFFVKDEALPFP